MAELFRYIEHAFAIPSATRSIDVSRQSDLQNSLRGEEAHRPSPDEMRSKASDFLERHFSSPVADPSQLGSKYLVFRSQLLGLTAPEIRDVDELVSKVFGGETKSLVASDAFLSDKALLDDALVCIKITTAFGRVNVHNLVAMRQVIGLLDDLAADKVTDVTPEAISATLRRSIRIPNEFVKPLPVKARTPEPALSSDPAVDAAARNLTDLMVEEQHLKSAYDAIMSLPENQFELKRSIVKDDRQATAMSARQAARRASSTRRPVKGKKGASVPTAASGDSIFLAVPPSAIERLGADALKTLQKANIDLTAEPVPQVLAAIKKQWQELSRRLAPYRVPPPSKVFRVGVNVFAVQDFTSPTVQNPNPSPPKVAT
jgi:hypothetical protein